MRGASDRTEYWESLGCDYDDFNTVYDGYMRASLESVCDTEGGWYIHSIWGITIEKWYTWGIAMMTYIENRIKTNLYNYVLSFKIIF